MKLPQIIFQFSNSYLLSDDLLILKGLLYREECEKKFFFLILHMKTHIKMQNINSGELKTKLSVNFACFSDKCNECEK